MVSVVFAAGTLLVGLLGFVMAGKQGRSAYSTYRRSNQLASATPIEPGQATPGEEATIVGTVSADDPLRTPMWGEECVAYRQFAEIGPLEGVHYPEETTTVPFGVEQNGSSVDVDREAVGIEATPEHTERHRTGVFSDYPGTTPRGSSISSTARGSRSRRGSAAFASVSNTSPSVRPVR